MNTPQLHEYRLAALERDKQFVASNTTTHGRWTIYPATGSTGGAKNIGVVLSTTGENDRYFRNVSEATLRAKQLDLPPVNTPAKRKGRK